MIYLNNISDVQMMYIPKSMRSAEGKVFFKAFSTTTLQGFSFHAEEEESALYHILAVELPSNLTDGEYEYTLSDTLGVLSTGLLVIGEASKPMEYNKETIYEQYTD